MSVNVRPFRGREGKWEVDIRFDWPDGEKYRERVVAPGTTKSAATKWANEREKDLVLRGKPLPQEVKKLVPTLSDFKRRYLDEHCRAERQKPSTIEHKEIAFRAYLEPIFGKRQLDDIDNTQVQKLKSSMAHLSPKSVNNVLTILSTVLKKAVDWNVIPSMPCTIKLLKVHYGERAFYDFHDLERLLEGARKVDPRAELVVLLGSNAGLRLGEILALRWTNVLFERGVLRVMEAEYKGVVTLPKGGRHRDVPLTARLTTALKAHRHLKGARVLYDDGGHTLTAKTVRGWMKQAEKRAGMEVTGKLHVLRHTFCSHLAVLGAPAKAVQELAGHADLTTTMRYMHLSPAARVDAVALLNRQPAEAARLVGTSAVRLMSVETRGDQGETAVQE